MIKVKPKLHIHNIYDAVSPRGMDIRDDLLVKFRKLINRGLLQINEGDSVVVTDDCPTEYIVYLLKLLNINTIDLFRTKAGMNELSLNTSNIFKDIQNNDKWRIQGFKGFEVNPYMGSEEIYNCSPSIGINIEEEQSNSFNAIEHFYDKSNFYKDCEENDLAIPPYILSDRDSLYDNIILHLNEGKNSLFIRPTRSGGSVGSFSVELKNNSYFLINDVNETTECIGFHEFRSILFTNINNSLWNEYIITETLDLHSSPGTTFYIDADNVRILGHTLQIMNSNHQFLGFLYPIEDHFITKYFNRIEESINKLSQLWQKSGLRGYANIDWMVTNDDQCYLAELNPRQTSVISPLSFLSGLRNERNLDGKFNYPNTCIITNDFVKPNRAISFNEIMRILETKKVLYNQTNEGEGIIITMPPLLDSQINSFGIMSVASNSKLAYSNYLEAINELSRHEENGIVKYLCHH